MSEVVSERIYGRNRTRENYFDYIFNTKLFAWHSSIGLLKKIKIKTENLKLN